MPLHFCCLWSTAPDGLGIRHRFRCLQLWIRLIDTLLLFPQGLPFTQVSCTTFLLLNTKGRKPLIFSFWCKLNIHLKVWWVPNTNQLSWRRLADAYSHIPGQWQPGTGIPVLLWASKARHRQRAPVAQGPFVGRSSTDLGIFDTFYNMLIIVIIMWRSYDIKIVININFTAIITTTIL